MHRLIILPLATALAPLAHADTPENLLQDNPRILFLGDSITHAGDYVAHFDAWLVRKFPDRRFTVINAGLSSETVSGLSEQNHAGGRFPRPCLLERLGRVLTKAQPDLIIACYGINCGIYQELDEGRFALFREGILKLRAAAEECGAEIVHITPPIYDNHGKPGFDYDTVLAAYSRWLVEQREQGWQVVDLHSEMRAKVDLARQTDPAFTLQRDKVHPGAEGHWLMAQSLIGWFGDAESAALESPSELVPPTVGEAIAQRMRTYQDAIHAETRPLRPGVRQEGTLESAAAVAEELEGAIYGSSSSPGQTGHLFILSGQSNMTGDLKQGFAATVHGALGEDQVTIVHCARPGRGIRFWVEDYELPEDHELHGKLKAGNGEEFHRLVTAVKDACDASSFQTVTLIWMQGESDAGRDLGAAYERSFNTLLEGLKEELGVAEMRFVIGRISDHGLDGDHAQGWETIREVQQQIAESDPLGSWIDTDDLNGGDGPEPGGELHYPARQSVTLGIRFGEAALRQLQQGPAE